MFDNRGNAASSGAPPDTIEVLAEALLEFVDALCGPRTGARFIVAD